MVLPGYNVNLLSTVSDGFVSRRGMPTIEDLRTDVREREKRCRLLPLQTSDDG